MIRRLRCYKSICAKSATRFTPARELAAEDKTTFTGSVTAVKTISVSVTICTIGKYVPNVDNLQEGYFGIPPKLFMDKETRELLKSISLILIGISLIMWFGAMFLGHPVY